MVIDYLNRLESNYEKAHRIALLRPIPFDTCPNCDYYKGGCTIGFRLKRLPTITTEHEYACKDFLSIEEATEKRIANKDW